MLQNVPRECADYFLQGRYEAVLCYGILLDIGVLQLIDARTKVCCPVSTASTKLFLHTTSTFPKEEESSINAFEMPEVSPCPATTSSAPRSSSWNESRRQSPTSTSSKSSTCSCCNVKFESLVQSLPHDYAFVRDLRGHEVSANDAWVKFTDRSHQQKVHHEAATEKLDLLFEKVSQEKTVNQENWTVDASDNLEGLMPDLWNATVFPINEDGVLVAVGGYIDVSHGTGTSEDVLDSPTKQEQLLLDHLPIAYCMAETIFDSTGKAVDSKFLNANTCFEDMTGLKNVIGKTATELIPGIENDPANWLGRAGKVVQEKGNLVDRFIQYSQKLERWYNGVTYYSKGNQAVTLFLDHSERLAMEQAIKESEERHQTLFENMQQGVIYHDASGLTLKANQSALRILGLTMDQVLGKPTVDTQWRFVREDGSTLPIEEYPSVVALTGKQVTSMKAGVFNIVENKIRWVLLDAMPLFREGEDTPYQAYTIFSDITEAKKVEENLIRAKEMAEEADQLKSAFLATMSHEIRTPLNGIMGHVELILSNSLSEDHKQENLDGLQVAMDSGNLLISIIQDVLDVSKIEAGQLDTVRRPIAIRDMAHETMNLANAYRLQRKKEQVELTASIDETLARHIYGDQFRLQQILNNLLSNAIKFTDEGTVTVSIQRGKRDNALETLEFSVRDTGKGIPDERLEMIFEPFRQVEIGDTRKHGGTGLGLTICKKLIEIMGGELKVCSSTQGASRGSCFNFTLPYEPCLEEEAIPRKSSQPQPVGPPRPQKTGKILLAEDDRVSRKVAACMLKKIGFDVLQAEDGIVTVSLFEKHRDSIDLILMDVMMPNMDGLEATARIREIESKSPNHHAPVPIVALSAGAMKGDREKGLEVGMTEYLYKPISLRPLQEAMERCLGTESA